MGLSTKKTGTRGGFTEINVTPLVDVMLVLLVVFMVAAPLLTLGVPVDLPMPVSLPAQLDLLAQLPPPPFPPPQAGEE